MSLSLPSVPLRQLTSYRSKSPTSQLTSFLVTGLSDWPSRCYITDAFPLSILEALQSVYPTLMAVKYLPPTVSHLLLPPLPPHSIRT